MPYNNARASEQSLEEQIDGVLLDYRNRSDIPAEKLDALRSNLRNLAKFSEILDSKFSIAGFRFGLDPLVGLIPVVGEVVPQVTSLYVVWQAAQLQVPFRVLIMMILNIVADTAVGAIPFLGDVFDAIFKANRRNTRLLFRCVEEDKIFKREYDAGQVAILIASILALIGLIVVSTLATIAFLIFINI